METSFQKLLSQINLHGLNAAEMAVAWTRPLFESFDQRNIGVKSVVLQLLKQDHSWRTAVGPCNAVD